MKCCIEHVGSVAFGMHDKRKQACEINYSSVWSINDVSPRLILPSLVSCLLLISIPITHIRSHSNGHATKGCFKKAWHFPPDNPRWHVDHRTLRPTWLSSTSSSFRWCLRYDPPVQVHVQISFFLWLVSSVPKTKGTAIAGTAACLLLEIIGTLCCLCT